MSTALVRSLGTLWSMGRRPGPPSGAGPALAAGAVSLLSSFSDLDSLTEQSQGSCPLSGPSPSTPVERSLPFLHSVPSRCVQHPWELAWGLTVPLPAGFAPGMTVTVVNPYLPYARH